VALFAAAELGWRSSCCARSVNEATAPRWLVLATRQIAARPGLRGGAGQRAGRGPAGAGAAGAAAHRPDRSWRAATPPDAPNRFVINVMPEQATPFSRRWRGGRARYDWYPMIRGRLVAVNGSRHARRLHRRPRQAPGGPRVQPQPRGQLPPHNEVAAGRWTPDEAGAVSVEEGLAKTWA
jgi:putative ABC transport system permease protein